MKKRYIQPDARCIIMPEPLMQQQIPTGSCHETEAKEASGIFEEQEPETSNGESSLWDSSPGSPSLWAEEDE